jgi:hypothetical protein
VRTHAFELLIRNLVIAHHRVLEGEDEKIQRHNDLMTLAQERLTAAQEKAHVNPSASVQLKLDRARIQFEKQVSIGKGLIKTGSGNVGIALPANSST